MKSSYKRLGDYIKFFNLRAIEMEKNLDIDSIRGISSISKSFIKTRANLVGVVADKYKVVKKNCFAYNPNTARMGDKIPIALNTTDDIVLVSSIYPTFKIRKTNELDPEYLMMWFKRYDFDRYARYKSHGSAREVFDIEEMNDLFLPVPSIEKQQEIVREYNTIQNRINLNNQLINKLEETAQAIYKQWFVEFEFPHNLCHAELVSASLANNLGYKSSGGKMVWCEELEKEIPEGWEFKSIKNFSSEMKSGSTPSRDNLEYWSSKDIPWIKTGELKNSVIISAEEYISRKGLNESSTKLIPINSVLIAMYGEGITKGQVGYLKIEAATNQACCAIICKNEIESTFLYYHLRINRDEIVSIANGGAQPNLSKNIIENLGLIVPTKQIIEKHPFEKIMKVKEKYTLENQKLEELKDLLLAKMTRVESEKESIQ